MWNVYIVSEQAVAVVNTCWLGYREESDCRWVIRLLIRDVGHGDSRFKKGYSARHFTRRHRDSFLPSSKMTFPLPSVRLKIWDVENLGSELLLESMKAMRRCNHGFPLLVLWARSLNTPWWVFTPFWWCVMVLKVSQCFCQFSPRLEYASLVSTVGPKDREGFLGTFKYLELYAFRVTVKLEFTCIFTYLTNWVLCSA